MVAGLAKLDLVETSGSPGGGVSAAVLVFNRILESRAATIPEPSN